MQLDVDVSRTCQSSDPCGTTLRILAIDDPEISPKIDEYLSIKYLLGITIGNDFTLFYEATGGEESDVYDEEN